MIKLMINIILRVLAVLITGFVAAVIGFIAGVIIIGTLSPFYALVFGQEFTFFGAEGYEAGGPIGFILGALIGLVGSSALFFGRRTKKGSLASSNADFQITPK